MLLELRTAEVLASRPFHGHVTAAERIGLARYRLVIEPWLIALAFIFGTLGLVGVLAHDP